ncbi:MAG: glycosyltransferase [Pseudomonadota bacterium]
MASRVLISAVGSRGDVEPLLRVGEGLRRRGHEVHVFANPAFAAAVSGAGMVFRPIGEEAEHRQGLADERITSSRPGLAMVADAVVRMARPTLESMRADVLKDRTLIVGTTFAFGARLLCELDRLPFAAVHLAPSVFRSEYEAPRLTPLGHFRHWPRRFKRGMFAAMDRRFLDPVFTAPFNVVRADLGLAPVSRLMHGWIHEAATLLGLFPAWLAERQPDWPAALVTTGFPLARPGEALSPELDRFLDAGSLPIVFTAGTANTSSRAFFDTSAAACARLGCRGVFVAARRDQLPERLPDTVMHVARAPFDRLFPRAAAVVHHGGIGTTAQAMASGIPQLIRPMAYDQFDNSSRARRLGVAIELLPRAYRGRRLDRALHALLGDDSLRRTCGELSQRLTAEDGIEAACDALEGTLDSIYAAARNSFS